MLASINSQKNIVPDRQQAGGLRYDGWLPVGLVHPKKNAEVAHNIAHAAWRILSSTRSHHVPPRHPRLCKARWLDSD